MGDTQSPDPIGWSQREAVWRRKLGRLRLGAEPLNRQIERYRRATLVLTLVCVGLGVMFLGLFTAFQRPDIGAILVVLLLAPIVSIAWIDFAILSRRARAYEVERRAFLQHQGDSSSL